VGNGPRDKPVPGDHIRKDLVENWFGGDRAEPSLPGSIGYWIGYRGDVAEIIRNSLCWAVELALGIPHRSDKTGRRHPWPIELFWTCPCPWFESWVVVRPNSVTVVFMTPSHQGSNVSETPVATSATTRPHDPGHPIPSYEDDYQRLGAANALPRRPRVAAHTREFATWVVTHKDHKIAKGSPIVTTNTAVLADFAEWGIPQLCPYQGVGGITIVSPSFPAGGVHHDGRP
jgi:hypothetical protein